MFSFLNRGLPDVRVDHESPLLAPSPLTIRMRVAARLREIDVELAELAAVADRTVHVQAAIDVLLDRRFKLCPARSAYIRPAVPVIPGPDGARRPS